MKDVQRELHKLFEYRDGKLFWKVDRGAKKCKGQEAGSRTRDGYRVIHVSNLIGHMTAHRVIWLMHNGELPSIIDHINGVKTDNRIENLRPASKSQNAYNTPSATNISGSKNVSWRSDTETWRVTMTIDGRKKSFGNYKDFELADLVAHEARCKYHGKFANHGVSV